MSDCDVLIRGLGPVGQLLALLLGSAPATSTCRLRIAAATLRRRGGSTFEVEHSTRMAAYFATGADGTPTKNVEQLAGHPPRTLAAFVSDHLSTKGN